MAEMAPSLPVPDCSGWSGRQGKHHQIHLSNPTRTSPEEEEDDHPPADPAPMSASAPMRR
jgi:hypothetical protein